METIHVDELEEELKNGGKLIDVREPDEFKEGHLAEAINIPLETVAATEFDKDKTYYVICRSGRRSAEAVRAMTKKKIRAVNVLGGMLEVPEEKIVRE
jgi:rhodanese-related sulfurtransferase